MCTRLEIIFDAVKIKSYQLRHKYTIFDGQAFWQPIKKELAKLNTNDFVASHWKPISKDIVHKIMSVPESFKNGYGEEIFIEEHHFLIQQVRIPTTEKPSIRKIIQLGLNIGQWYGKPDKSLMKELKYETLNLNKLSRYVSKKDIEKISKNIPDESIQNIINYLSTQK